MSGAKCPPRPWRTLESRCAYGPLRSTRCSGCAMASSSAAERRPASSAADSPGGGAGRRHRHARQWNLRLRLIRRARRIRDGANLLRALHRALDAGAVDRRLVLRCEHLLERLRHGHRLRLAAQHAIEVRLDAIRGETLPLRRRSWRCRRASSDRRRAAARASATSCENCAYSLRLVFGAERDLRAVRLLEHHLAAAIGDTNGFTTESGSCGS